MIDSEDQITPTDATRENSSVSLGGGPPGIGGQNEARRHRAEIWVREHGDVLWRFCMARAGSAELAEELVQETLVAAMESWGRFEGAATERTWLIAIAVRKIADHFRRAPRSAQLEIDDAEACGPDGCGDIEGLFTPKGKWAAESGWSEPDRESDMSQQLRALRRCIESLSPGLGEALWLREISGMSGAQVCKAMGLTATNLWTRLHRARLAVRLCMETSLSSDREGDA